MASKATIAEAMRFLAGALPSTRLTNEMLTSYAELLAGVDDIALMAASRALAREPQRRFFPSAGEILEACAPPAQPVYRPSSTIVEIYDRFFATSEFDEAEWAVLAEQLDRLDKPHMAENAREKCRRIKGIMAEQVPAEAERQA
jgi:hypothetical protein